MPSRLLDQPGGENRSLPETLEHLPGVTLGQNGRGKYAISSGAPGSAVR